MANSPYDISLSSLTFDENISAGSVIATISASDSDQSDGHSFALDGDFIRGKSFYGDNSSFSIEGNQLKINISPDHEAKDLYHNTDQRKPYLIRIKTTDSDGNTYAKDIEVTTNDLNEAPDDIDLRPVNPFESDFTYLIEENISPDNYIATISKSDPDFGYFSGGELSFASGVGDEDNSSFIIKNHYYLYIKDKPDYEIKDSYSFRLKLSDNGGLSYEEAFTINVENLYDEKPTDIKLSTTNFDENIGTDALIAIVTTTDPDSNDSHSYSLVEGIGDDDNDKFKIQWKSKNPYFNHIYPYSFYLVTGYWDVNYENKSSYNIRVRSTDNGGNFYEEPFTLQVNDINETPSSTLLSSYNFNENISPGTTIASLSTKDDIGDTHVYKLLDGTIGTSYGKAINENSFFTIEDNLLKINSKPNYEEKFEYNFYLQTTSSDGNVQSQVITLKVNNLVEKAPTSLTTTATTTSDSTPTITGSAEADSTVKLYSGTTLLGSATADSDGAFSITSSTLSEGSYSLTATATDAAGNISSTSDPLSITFDKTVPEAPTSLTTTAITTNDTTPTITGSAKAGSTVKLYSGTTLLGSATAESDGAFSITSSTLSEGSYSLTATATNEEGNASSASDSLSITVDTTDPMITGPSGSAGEITSNKSINETETNVTNFTANETVTWSLNGGADHLLFNINGKTGALSFSAAQDYENPSDSDKSNDYVVVVRATDSAGNTSDQTATINIYSLTTDDLIMSTADIADIHLWSGDDHTIKLYISPGGDNWNIYSSALGSQVNTSTITPTATQYSAIRETISKLNDVLTLEIMEVNTLADADAPILIHNLEDGYAVGGQWNPSYNNPVHLTMTGDIPSSNMSAESWKKVFIHELGHLLGLEHPWDNSDGDAAFLNQSASIGSQTVMGWHDEYDRQVMNWYQDIDLKALKEIWNTENISKHIIGQSYLLKGIKDFDGNLHANTGSVSDELKSSYKYQGSLDINNDEVLEAIYTNKVSGRWAAGKINSSTSRINYEDHGAGGGTRVVGIYDDPLISVGLANGGFLEDGVTPAPAQFGATGSDRYTDLNGDGDFDDANEDRLALNSQVRFQNDLLKDNLTIKHSGDYNGDGFQEVYWKTNNADIYLRSLMHSDGNIQYANYQNQSQMNDYLTSYGYGTVISDII